MNLGEIQRLQEMRNLVEKIQDEELSAEGTTGRDFIKLKVLNVEPRKPRKGLIVYADGTNWNPGSGEGIYVYKSAWVLLG